MEVRNLCEEIADECRYETAEDNGQERAKPGGGTMHTSFYSSAGTYLEAQIASLIQTEKPEIYLKFMDVPASTILGKSIFFVTGPPSTRTQPVSSRQGGSFLPKPSSFPSKTFTQLYSFYVLAI